MESNFLGNAILFLVILIALWFLFRELICWYYKINESISLQKKTNELLEILINKIDGNEGLDSQTSSSVSSDGNFTVFANNKKEHGIVFSVHDLGQVNWYDAKRLCEEYREGGFSDWRLPTKIELQKLYSNRNKVNGLTSSNYWSSSEFNSDNAWNLYVHDGSCNYGNKNNTISVRAVRSFQLT